MRSDVTGVLPGKNCTCTDACADACLTVGKNCSGHHKMTVVVEVLIIVLGPERHWQNLRTLTLAFGWHLVT